MFWVTPHELQGAVRCRAAAPPATCSARRSPVLPVFLTGFLRKSIAKRALSNPGDDYVSLVRPWLRFHIPLIEPDWRIARIRLSDKTSRLHPCLPRLLPAGAIAGWALHPLEQRRLITAQVKSRHSSRLIGGRGCQLLTSAHRPDDDRLPIAQYGARWAPSPRPPQPQVVMRGAN
jgi:hypothetical protein